MPITLEGRGGIDKMKGFTLLEIIVVIVILGIMATLAATQYTKMVEKARGAEARIIMGSIRTNEAATRLQNGLCSSDETTVGVGYDYPSTCAATHYFSYDIVAAATNTFTAKATRCTAAGKNPNYTSAQTIILTTNFDNGWDSWTLTAPY
jgi:prepilin-type N-terminal cleavage/methylation domain-containing protein